MVRRYLETFAGAGKRTGLSRPRNWERRLGTSQARCARRSAVAISRCKVLPPPARKRYCSRLLLRNIPVAIFLYLPSSQVPICLRRHFDDHFRCSRLRPYVSMLGDCVRGYPTVRFVFFPFNSRRDCLFCSHTYHRTGFLQEHDRGSFLGL